MKASFYTHENLDPGDPVPASAWGIVDVAPDDDEPGGQEAGIAINIELGDALAVEVTLTIPELLVMMSRAVSPDVERATYPPLMDSFTTGVPIEDAPFAAHSSLSTRTMLDDLLAGPGDGPDPVPCEEGCRTCLVDDVEDATGILLRPDVLSGHAVTVLKHSLSCKSCRRGSLPSLAKLYRESQEALPNPFEQEDRS